jgi:hypothetical protein
VSLAWSAASGASGYNVKRSIASGAYSQVASTTLKVYTDKGLTKGTVVCYVISGYNANGTEGAASASACATVQ